MGFTGMEREELSSLQPSRTKCSDNCLSDCVCARVCAALKVCSLVAHPLPSPRAGEVGGTLVVGVLLVPAPPV